MTARIGFVGSNETTKPAIEASFKRLLSLLEAHLASRLYMLGGRPSFGDFGLWAQLYEAATDPTPGAIMRASSPRVMAWIERMLAPRVESDFETWESLTATLSPLLAEEVGAMFLPWSTANAQAILREDKEFAMTLRGTAWMQVPQKYHARSLAEIRRKYAAAKDAPGLNEILAKADCLRWLTN